MNNFCIYNFIRNYIFIEFNNLMGIGKEVLKILRGIALNFEVFTLNDIKKIEISNINIY